MLSSLKMALLMWVAVSLSFVLFFTFRPFFGFSYGLLAFGMATGAVAGVAFAVAMAALGGYRQR